MNRRRLPKGLRRGPAPIHPRGLERAYTRDLIAYSRRLSRTVRKALGGAGVPRVRLDADPTGVDFERLRLRLGRLADDTAIELTEKYGARLASFSARDLARVLGIDVTKEPPAVLRVLAAWRRENVDLIQSIAERLHDDVREVVTEAVERGTRHEVLARRLAERYDVSDSRAALIARDQIAKGNADIAQVHMTQAGVSQYAWSTSRDEKVRPLHAALEGLIFSFDDPPVTNEKGEHNNPGEDIQCRCVAIPIMGDGPEIEVPREGTGAPAGFEIPDGGVRSRYFVR